MKSLLYLLTLLQPVGAVFAQDMPTEITQVAVSVNMFMNILIVVFIITALLALIASLVLLKTVKLITNKLSGPALYGQPVQAQLKEHEALSTIQESKPGIWTKILGLKPASEEKDIMLEHQFDGITELDNPTPGWFMWLFYSTIVFALVYLIYYHVLDYGKLQEEEYTIEMGLAKAERTAYLAKSASNIDENSVKESKDATVISGGQAVFKANCVICHGDKGQGVVGPNLTDEYWLHGSGVNNIFKTIKYGVPEKGMIPWEKTLTPKQISDVSNYILTLAGTNPSGGKAPQGDVSGATHAYQH